MSASIFTPETLMEQAQLLTTRKFSPGFDNMGAGACLLWMGINGHRLARELEQGLYDPQPAVGFTSAKRDGHYRLLSHLTAIDTVIQNVILRAVTPHCEEKFSSGSFAYREGRGVNAAITQFCFYGTRYAYAARLDSVSCFDSIPHDKLRASLEDMLKNAFEQVIPLIMKYAAQPLCSEGRVEQRCRGILQGAPLSPLLCNICLTGLDRYLEEQHIPFIRYADDVVVFADTLPDIENYTDHVALCYRSLGLSLNEKKHALSSPCDMVFLGHRFSRDRRGMITLTADDSVSGAYYAWHTEKVQKGHRTVDILSDGILRQKDFSLLFDMPDGKENIPAEAVDSINIYSSVVFDNGFLETAFRHRISVNVFDRHGDLLGRFLPNRPLISPLLTNEQLTCYYDTPRRLELARQFVLASIHNLVLIIRYYRKYKAAPLYTTALDNIDRIRKNVRVCPAYDTLLMLEAQARKEYYSCFDTFIAGTGFTFEKRSRRPPLNEVNALISFGNTILYNRVATRIERTALDIRVGFLHATNSTRAETLDLDIADVFKPLIVDRVVFTLLNRKVLKANHFTHEENGAVYLSNEGKHLFLRAFYDKLDEQLTVKGSLMTYDMLLEEEVRKLVRAFRDKERYIAYRQVR